MFGNLTSKKMVEIFVLSDDEDGGSSNHGIEGDGGVSDVGPSTLNHPGAQVGHEPKRVCKLVLVDSRQCPWMPRPRFLPIGGAHEAVRQVVPHHSSLTQSIPEQREINASARAVASAAEIDDEEADPDYEDARPPKRRKTSVKKVPKRHGKLTTSDWEVVRMGNMAVEGTGRKKMPPQPIVYDRRKARNYVKKLTANIDWEETLRHLGTLKLATEESRPGERPQEMTQGKPRRGPSQANRLKQYLQKTLTNRVVEMNVGAANGDKSDAKFEVSSNYVYPGGSQPRKVPPSSSPPPSSKSSSSPPSK